MWNREELLVKATGSIIDTGSLKDVSTVARLVPPQARYATIASVCALNEPIEKIIEANAKSGLILTPAQNWQGIDYTHPQLGYLWHDSTTLGFSQLDKVLFSVALSSVTIFEHYEGLILAMPGQAYLLSSVMPIDVPEGFLFHHSPGGIKFSTSVGGWLDEFIALGKIDATAIAAQKRYYIKILVIFILVFFAIILVIALLTRK